MLPIKIKTIDYSKDNVNFLTWEFALTMQIIYPYKYIPSYRHIIYDNSNKIFLICRTTKKTIQVE